MSIEIDKDVIVLTEAGDEINECLSITALTWSNGNIVADDSCDVQTPAGVSIFKITANKNNGFYSLNIAQPLCVDGIKIVTLDNGQITIYRR